MERGVEDRVMITHIDFFVNLYEMIYTLHVFSLLYALCLFTHM